MESEAWVILSRAVQARAHEIDKIIPIESLTVQVTDARQLILKAFDRVAAAFNMGEVR